MNNLGWRGALPGIGLIIAVMAMALSCGGASEAPTADTEQAFATSSAAAPADQERLRSDGAAAGAAPVPTAAPVAMSAPAQSAPNAPADVPAQPREPEVAAKAQTDKEESAPAQQAADRQLIVEAWLGLEVNDIDAAVRQLEALAAQRSGWVESAEIFGEAGYRSASLRVRVPADDMNNAMDAFRVLGRVTDEGISATDVTERLIDNEARLTAWHAQEERLVTLLENAPTVEDVIQIERRISEVRADIEQVEATQRNLTNRVATSLITVNLRLPARFAAEPPHGALALTVADPSATADAVLTIVESLDGYVGEKREYDEGGGQTVRMVAFVRPNDLPTLMDYAATLGEPTERRLDSVGPALDSPVPNAPLTLSIHSHIALGGSMSISTSEPLAVGEQIRAHAESLGGFLESWHEFRDDEDQSVNMALVVKSTDLRSVMDFGTGLGKTEHWEYNAAGQNPADDAPTARLSVAVYTKERFGGNDIWVIVVVVAVAIGLIVAILIALLMLRRRRAAPHTAANLEPDASG